MPVWHEATRELRESGKVQLVGIVQEQHADRTKLYAQWKQFEWPILVDSLNLLEVAAVPMVLLLDDQGVVRSVLRNPKEDLKSLLRTVEGTAPPAPADSTSRRPCVAEIEGVRDLIYFQEPPRYTEAVSRLARFLENDSENGPVHFALGVVLRARFDSNQRQSGDFQRAVRSWQRALDIDPNQYIWRRRIQQYGPPSDKPYPFYDWVDEARRDIAAQGGVPVPLVADLTASELAEPVGTPTPKDESPANPDPDGRITRDHELIETEVTAVPPQPRSGEAVHVYVSFRPNLQADAHWNNESEPMKVYVDIPAGWSAYKKLVVLPAPTKGVTEENRTVEFDLRLPHQPGEVDKVHGFAVYNVCRGATGECLYRRQDFTIQLAHPPLSP